MTRTVDLVVNGESRTLRVQDSATLLDAFRENLELTGTKLVCGRGECGACTVLLDGRLAYSCLTLAAACEGVSVRTIEGVSTTARDGTPVLHPVQDAFIRHDAAQCGFCTPGQILAAITLLESYPSPDDDTIRHRMSGNLCRCGTYPKIIDAIRDVASSGTTGTP